MILSNLMVGIYHKDVCIYSNSGGEAENFYLDIKENISKELIKVRLSVSRHGESCEWAEKKLCQVSNFQESIFKNL